MRLFKKRKHTKIDFFYVCFTRKNIKIYAILERSNDFFWLKLKISIPTELFKELHIEPVEVLSFIYFLI